MVSTTAEMIADGLRRYGEDATADWVQACTDDELARVCSVAWWVYNGGGMLTVACALAAVYVKEGRPRDLARKRRKPATTAEGPLLRNGRRPSLAASERADAYSPFYGVGDDAIQRWRPADERDDWRRRRQQAIARGQSAGFSHPDGPGEDLAWTRPTHAHDIDGRTSWMPYVPVEIDARIAAHVGAVSADRHGSYAIHGLPPGASLGDELDPLEWMQTAGTDDRLIVEVHRHCDGVHRLNVVGRGDTAAGEIPSETIALRTGRILFVRPGEVLTADEVTALLQHYHHHDRVLDGWSLRELPPPGDDGLTG